MPNFRRYYIPNALVFITTNTRNHKRYFSSETNINLLLQTVENVKGIHPFTLLAYVILPDHFHWILIAEDDYGNFSKVMQSIKWNYTYNFKKEHKINQSIKLWQPRFWDHVIRNEQDLENHMDYIHWNPVKHELVAFPGEWSFSSFQHWCNRGYYPDEWGKQGQPSNIVNMDFE